MRFMSTLLMIYVLVLTFIPCSDHFADSHSHKQSFQTSSNHSHEHSEKQDHEHESHDCSKDTCTPFCTCSCCGIALNAADFHLFKLEKPFEAYSFNELPIKFYPLVSKYQENIWQPPQV